MKQIITFLAIACLAIACQKSPLIEKQSNSTLVAGAKGDAKGDAKGLVGTWQLTEYWADNGTGNGQWISANFEEQIVFGDDGSFRSTPTFPLYPRNYMTYVTKGSGYVTFFSDKSETGDQYQYTLETPTQLLFFPICRENCARRYQLK